jgi:hypothetical protein
MDASALVDRPVLEAIGRLTAQLAATPSEIDLSAAARSLLAVVNTEIVWAGGAPVLEPPPLAVSELCAETLGHLKRAIGEGLADKRVSARTHSRLQTLELRVDRMAHALASWRQASSLDNNE